MGLPLSFCNTGLSVGYPEPGWRSWDAGGGGAVQYTGVVGRCRGHHTHHLLLYYHSPGTYMVLQINQKCCFFNYKKLKYANLTLLRDSVL